MKDLSINQKTGSPPIDIYGDPQKIIGIFKRFITLILVGITAGIIFEYLRKNALAATFLGFCLLLVLASLYFINRKEFETASAFLAGILITLITAVSTVGLGIRQISITAYPAVLIIASLVVRQRIMAFITVYNILCAAWLIFGEIYGVYQPEFPSHTTIPEFFLLTLILIFTSLMVRLLTESLFANNLRLQKELHERRRVEEQREALIDELAARNEELTRFTYTVSHEMKSPVVTMKGFIGSVTRDLKNREYERVEKDMNRIETAVDKMHEILSNLLELSRIGRVMNEPVDVPFETIVGEALDIVHGQLESHQVTVQTQPKLPIVRGDRQRLVEVLQNLIDNASKYMGEQTDRLIEIGQQGQEEGMSVFFVRDNGMGIDPEYHERIFGLFNKLDAKSEGTGVGLALVKRIIEIHGGRIWIESEFGRGATFYFTLPMK